MGESERVQCAHGYWLEQDSCPGCDADRERPHPADMVALRILATGRLGKRCRKCGGGARDAAHVTARGKRARRAVNTARQGAAFEREVMAELESYGYIAMRSAASKGAVDVVAWPPLTNRAFPGLTVARPLVLIQCKLSDPVIPPAERRAVLEVKARTAEAVAVVAHRVDGKIHYRELTGAGPKDWRYWFPLWCDCGKPECPGRPSA